MKPVEHLARKLVTVEKSLAEQHGRFTLFALLLRDGAPDRWDLLVSAPWILRDEGKGLQTVSEAVSKSLSTSDLLMISRVVPVSASAPELAAFHGALSIEHSCTEIERSSFFGIPIEHAFIITSQRSTAASPRST